VTARRDESERTCILTRSPRPPDELIRFVVAPDGELVPDIRRRLPGRGVWVTADAQSVAEAERRRLFARALQGPVTVAPGLADRLDALLLADAVAALSMARKAGTAVAGFTKVSGALAAGRVVALIHAPEAAADGVAGLAAAARRSGAPMPPIVRELPADQLDLAFGRTNVIHAALLAGPASKHALTRIRALAAYRGGVAVAGGARKTRALDDVANAPAGTDHV
jgi:predicted RNA-binding protein YlxR (DUF448 family)